MDNITRYEVQLRKYAISEMKKLDNVIIYNSDADVGIISFNIIDKDKILFGHDVSTYLSKHGCV